jgi:SAM-dependent methyltransferase
VRTLCRLPQAIGPLGWRGTARAVLRRLAHWLESPLDRREQSAPTHQSASVVVETDLAAPTLISPDYVAFQQMPARVIARYLNLSGCQVLEIGGAQAALSARAFLDAGAARVVVTGLDHIEQAEESKDQRLVILQADALDLLHHLQPASFDVVFGLSIIEHIHNPGLFLQQVQAVLKPGGLALFEGYPLWTSALGHHLWVASWGGSYQGRSSGNYLFAPIAAVTSSNPVPDWGHLLMCEAELEHVLQAQSLPGQDIACILNWIYHNPELNRLDSTSICSAYTTSGLTVLEANIKRQDVPADILTKLRELHGERIDYGLSGLVIVLAKPE